MPALLVPHTFLLFTAVGDVWNVKAVMVAPKGSQHKRVQQQHEGEESEADRHTHKGERAAEKASRHKAMSHNNK